MALVNELKISGRAGRDAQRYGNGPFKFSIAHGGGLNRKTGDRFPTLWINVVAWPRDLPDAEQVRKGDSLIVTGRLTVEEWKDKNTGEQKSMQVLVATSIEADEDSPRQQRHSEPPAGYQADTTQGIDEDSIPF